MAIPRLCGTPSKFLHTFSTIILPDHVSRTDLANSFGHFFQWQNFENQSRTIVICFSFYYQTKYSQQCPIFFRACIWGRHSQNSKILSFQIMSFRSNTNLTGQRVGRHPNHPDYQYHKLLTQRRVFPKLFQNCICCPLLKKPSLDRNLLKNYRPVSNLSFISKLTEKLWVIS